MTVEQIGLLNIVNVSGLVLKVLFHHRLAFRRVEWAFIKKSVSGFLLSKLEIGKKEKRASYIDIIECCCCTHGYINYLACKYCYHNSSQRLPGKRNITLNSPSVTNIWLLETIFYLLNQYWCEQIEYISRMMPYERTVVVVHLWMSFNTGEFLVTWRNSRYLIFKYWSKIMLRGHNPCGENDIKKRSPNAYM